MLEFLRSRMRKPNIPPPASNVYAFGPVEAPPEPGKRQSKAEMKRLVEQAERKMMNSGPRRRVLILPSEIILPVTIVVIGIIIGIVGQRKHLFLWHDQGIQLESKGKHKH